MDSSAHQPVLLAHDTLVMQQITGFMSNDFDILDATGQQAIGHVSTSGGGLSHLVAGSRSLDVADADGSPLLHVEDPMSLGFDHFRLSTPEGAPLAEVTSRFALFSTRVRITMADGTDLELSGDMLGLDFEFQVQGAVAARVSRKWAGLGRGVLGRSRYAVGIEPTVPAQLRLAIIGGCIVLDLIRRKKQNQG
ncbi:LURP-one-related/scramblase family protein [Brachybacterium sp. 107]|uniref:LURP-one-related/scramblase family protein n=1 Tax=Brachybacterium sp. 107 TaxID=3457736 RepID=UPI0040346DCC